MSSVTARRPIPDPDPWDVLRLTSHRIIDPRALDLWIADQRSFSARFLAPYLRRLGRLLLVLVLVIRTVIPAWPALSGLGHRLAVLGLGWFVRPGSTELLLRHFHVGSAVLRTIAASWPDGDFRADADEDGLVPTEPVDVAELADHLVLRHDVALFQAMAACARQTAPLRRAPISPGTLANRLDRIVCRPGPLRWIDLETALCLFTPVFALCWTRRQFSRAVHSLQCDETVATLAATLLGKEDHLHLVINRLPLVPATRLDAARRLIIHGIQTEILHEMLRRGATGPTP
jgi:hypothetical protein